MHCAQSLIKYDFILFSQPKKKKKILYFYLKNDVIFFKEFQPIASAPNDSYLSLD